MSSEQQLDVEHQATTDWDVSAMFSMNTVVSYLRELDLEEERYGKLDADFDESDQDSIDGSEDTEVDAQAELDDPLATRGRDFLRGRSRVNVEVAS